MKQIVFIQSLILIFVVSMNMNAFGQCNAPTGDICSDALDFGVVETSLCLEGISIIETREGCLFGANPEPGLEGCSEFSTTGTVWFKAGYNADAIGITATVDTDGEWDPRISIYKGNDCSDLAYIYSCSTAGSDVNVADANIGQSDNPMAGTIWIAVSYDSSTVDSVTDLGFTLSVQYKSDCVPTSFDGLDSLITGDVSIVKRSVLPITDTSGVFCPGEEVTLCLNFDIDNSSSTLNWVHGLIPRFGKGWDLVNSDLEGARISPDTARWVEWDDPNNCSVIANYIFPSIVTYYDESGELQFSSVNLGRPMESKYVVKGDTLPSGWFYRSRSPNCGMPGCSPSDYWGLPGSSQEVSLEICLDLKVKENFGSLPCLENNALDIKVLPTTDGLTGCWDSQDAYYSQTIVFDFGGDWEIDCECSTLGIDEDVVISDMTLYPNPVQDHIYVKNMEQTEYEVLDMYGKRISLGQYNSATGIVTKGLSSGIYILRMKTSEGWSWGRFVKE